jgi:subtilisin family serine protease
MPQIYKFLLLYFIALLSSVSSMANQQSPLTADLLMKMDQTSSGDLLRINIRLAQQYEPARLDHIRQLPKEEKRQYVVNELKWFSQQSQQSIIDELDQFSRSGEASEVRSLWITNIINLYATPAVIGQLALNPAIERIDLDEERILIEPVDFTEVANIQEREITYNVSIMNVPEVWDLGFFGEDVVVGVLDTGVNYNHNDLAGNMWSHPDFPNHGWNFVNNNNDPMDFHSHGTHCAGTVAGNGASGSQTGMAPSAKIMALMVLGADGGGTEFGIWSGIQFGVEYGAHILSLSLGWQHAWNPDRASWRNAMDNALAAGVINIVAAGNEGNQQAFFPVPGNVRTPGDIPAPWRHPEQADTGGRSAVVSVGASNQADNIAGFSSRGPVTWQNIPPYNDYPYNPGTGLIRPDVVAPGVDVKSLRHNSNTGYTTMSGTSMATPAVAGVTALMISKNPGLTPEEISQLLEMTAVKLVPHKNNTSGSGRVDALAAIHAVNYPGPIYSYHSLNDEAGNNDGYLNPNEFILLNLAMINNSDNAFENVDVTIRSLSPYITITDSLANYGNFLAGQEIMLENAFSFQVAADIPGLEMVAFEVETNIQGQSYTSRFTVEALAPNVVVDSFSIDDSNDNNNGRLDPGENVLFHIVNKNLGQLAAMHPQVSLVSNSPFLTVLEGIMHLDDIQPESEQGATYSISIEPATPQGETVSLSYMIWFDNYSISKTYNLRVGGTVEDFETGDFEQFDWFFSGSQPWNIESGNNYLGNFSARSGAIGHSRFTQLILEMDVAHNDSIEFMYRVSSEPVNDFLRFYIDNTMAGQWSGETGWQHAKFAVEEGKRRFLWVYFKNGTVSMGEDAAWVDNIVFPQPPTIAAFAGQDAYACGNQPFTLQSIIRNAAEIHWQTAGDGAFSDVSTAQPVYTPGNQDLVSGSVVLSLSVAGINGEEKSDEMLLSFVDFPTVSISDGLIVCEDETAEISLHFTGEAPWSLELDNEIGLITSTDPIHTLSLNPPQTTTYSIISFTDAMGCSLENDFSFTLVRTTPPESPMTPVGPAEVDFAYNQQSAYSVNPVEFATSYIWMVLPTEAGTAEGNEANAVVNWNDSYTGPAILAAKALNACGESSFSETLVIDVKNTTSIDENFAGTSFRLYPNPSAGFVNLAINSRIPQQMLLTITNRIGQQVYSEEFKLERGSTDKRLHLNYLESGVYQFSFKSIYSTQVNRLIISR